jgi:cephalosporin hydroxylase
MLYTEIIQAFHALYSGGLAQAKRDAGEPNAMPPWAEVYWMGKQVVKCPMDLWVYQEILCETKPDLLIETGTSGAGSAFFFASIFDRLGNGHILTVDTLTYPHLCHPHPRITYRVGDSILPGMIADIRNWAKDLGPSAKIMLSMDSLHTYDHVKAELAAYADLVTPGCYCVVEDVHYPPGDTGGDPAWGSKATYEFEVAHPEFKRDLSRERHLLTSNVWFRRT